MSFLMSPKACGVPFGLPLYQGEALPLVVYFEVLCENRGSLKLGSPATTKTTDLKTRPPPKQKKNKKKKKEAKQHNNDRLRYSPHSPPHPTASPFVFCRQVAGRRLGLGAALPVPSPAGGQRHGAHGVDDPRAAGLGQAPWSPGRWRQHRWSRAAVESGEGGRLGEGGDWGSLAWKPSCEIAKGSVCWIVSDFLGQRQEKAPKTKKSEACLVRGDWVWVFV